MLKKIATIVIALVAVFLLVVATRPSHFRVERSVRIAATPEQVFPFIDDFRQWGNWSPWERLDPNMQRQFSGPPRGTGAGYDWSGNDEVGVGAMHITSSQPPRHVTIQLEFKQPWQASNVTTFDVDPAPAGSEVRWAMEGENGFMMKAAALFMNMDQMIGKDFATGLGNLKGLAETQAGRRAVQMP